MTVPEQLTEYLKSVAPNQISSGQLQRMEWMNEDGTPATPRSVVRRLQELAWDKVLVVENKKKNHAWYSFGEPKRRMWIYELGEDGIRHPKLTFI